jgi:acetyl-CoA carboxylase biotin carboxyl carrier protein
MVEQGLDFLEVKDNSTHIRLNRQSSAAEAPGYPPSAPRRGGPSSPKPALVAAAAHQKSINSPLAGVFYRASSPTNPPFSKEGDVVEAGQTLCIIEAMKVMNEIKAEERCRIVRIPAENARPVTAGQALFFVEPA